MFGGNKIHQLVSNIDALNVVLTDEHIREIESVVPFESGFPHKYIVSLIMPYSNFSILTNALGARVTVPSLRLTMRRRFGSMLNRSQPQFVPSRRSQTDVVDT